MDKINKAAAAGVIFFSVVLAGFVGIKVDQTTIALLGGAFIGLVVAIPTTALIIVIGMGGSHKHDDAPAPTTPPPPQWQPSAPAQHTHNYYIVIVQPDAAAWQLRQEAASQLRLMPHQAQQLIEAGQVQFIRQLPTPKSS